jgi:hypothetical protein
MQKIYTHLIWVMDYYVGYLMTNPRKLPFYHRMMYEKWGNRYCTREQFEEYWNSDQHWS